MDNWRETITEATNEPALLALARDFVATLPPDCIEQLPLPCRPRRLVAASDISLLTYRLKHAYCGVTLDPACIPHIERLVEFFDAVSDRIFELRSASPPRRRIS